MRIKNHFHIKGWTLNLVYGNRGPGELRNGLLPDLCKMADID